MRRVSVVGYEGRYEVDESGAVFSILRGRRRLKPSADVHGYQKVTLYPSSGAREVNVYIHRIVAQAFVGDCPLGMQVNHIDGVKANNAIGNLEYLTGQGNCLHRSRVLGKIGMGREQRSEVARRLWNTPGYREKIVKALAGRATNKGYRCTPEQVANRQRAARISNMKRNHGEQWRAAYVDRYPQFAHEVAS